MVYDDKILAFLEKVRYMQNYDDEQRKCDIYHFSKMNDEDKRKYIELYSNPLDAKWNDINWVFKLSKKTLVSTLDSIDDFEHISEVGFSEFKIFLLYQLALLVKSDKKYSKIFKDGNYRTMLEGILNKSVIDKTFTDISEDFICTLPYCVRCRGGNFYDDSLAAKYLLNWDI